MATRAAEFTTYATVQLDPQSQRAFSDMERMAKRAYGTVAQAAAEASAQTTRLMAGGGIGNIGGVASALRQQAEMSRQLAGANNQAASTMPRVASGVREIGTAAAGAAANTQFLSRSLRTTAEALAVVQGPLGPLAGRLSAAGRALTSLTGVQLGAATVAGIAFAVARVGNEYQTLQARLKAYFPDQKNVNNAMMDIISISRQSRVSLETTAALYTRLTQASTQFHLSQQDVAKITRTATQAAVLSGAPSQTQQAGLYELSAGLEAGKLQGRQLRALLIDLPQLGQAIAKGLGVTVGQLHDMGTKGLLTTEAVSHALINSSNAVNASFQRMPVTLSQAATVFHNSFEVVIGQMDQAVGLSSNLGKLLVAAADNMHPLLSAAAGVAVTFAAVKTTGWASGIADAVKSGQEYRNLAAAIGIATQQQAQANAELAAAEVERATQAATAAEQEIARLETEIALTAELRNQQLAVLQQGPLAPVGGAAQFNTSSYRAAQAAEAEGQQQLQILTGDLTRAKEGQVAATVAQTEAEQTAAAAGAELETVMGEEIVSTGAFAGAMGGLLSTGNLVIAGIATLAAGLIYYTTSENAAQRATEAARQAMSDYSDVVDETTGKVKTLTVAEGQRAEAEARSTIGKWLRGTGAEARSQLADSVANLGAKMTVASGETFGFDSSPKPGQDALLARNKRFADLISSPNPDIANQGLGQVEVLANSGDQAAKKWLEDNKALIDSIHDLGKAARQAQTEIDVLHGGTAPEAKEHQAQADADRRARAAEIAAEQRSQIAESNTLDDNALYQKNLKSTYKAFSGVGVLSPDEIQERKAQLALLRTEPIAPGQDLERQRAIRQQNEDLLNAIRISNQYKGTIEDLARARTKADTAQRDANRQQTLDNKDERKAIEQAKADATASLDQSLLALAKNQANMTPAAYHQAEVALLKTYDDQISALDHRANASNRATTTEIANVRKETAAYEQFENQRANILTRYAPEPKPAQRADDDIRKLTQAQASMPQFYSTQQLNQDVALIRDGLEKPYHDYLRDQQQSYQVQLLQLQGHQTEAAALQKAFQLYDQIGKLGADQYDQIVSQVKQEQTINDLLASRGRIYAAIEDVGNETRQELIQFLTDLPNQGLKAGGALLKNILANFERIQITTLVEKITGGIDPAVRGLIEGQTTVKGASAFFAQQINSNSAALSSSATQVLNLGTAAQSTSSTMLQAANDFATGISSTLTSLQSSGAQAAAVHLQDREKAQWPLPGFTATSSGFQQRTNPITGRNEFHTGLDIPAPAGTPVEAAFGGKVVLAGKDGGYGNAVKIDVGNGLSTFYGHLSSIDVHLGDIVRQGERVGEVGSTGMSTGNHLHYGTYVNGRPVDPRSVTNALVDVSGGGGGGGMMPLTSADYQSLAQTVGGLHDDSLAARMGNLIQPTALEPLRQELQPIATNQAAIAAALGNKGALGMGYGDIPTAKQTYQAAFNAIGNSLDKTFGTTFFKGMGTSFSTALQGAGEGAIASGFMKAIGIKTSQTGAEIGGALGSLIPGLPPGVGGLIGSIAGGLIGNLFAPKPTSGQVTIGNNGFGNLGITSKAGANAAYVEQSTADANSIMGQVNQIAQELGATVNGAKADVSIGEYKGTFRVNPTGGETHGPDGGFTAYASEQDAIQAAVVAMITQGVLTGISAASQKILESGQDLQTAITKAAAIEAIPKQLKSITDPVGEAVDQLNMQFTQLISYLKEGGATAQQFANAQQLYDNERQQAITQAEAQATGSLTALIASLTASTSSPLNKRTVYQNALANLTPLESQVNSGHVVDQGQLATAVQNFEAASQALNGSGASFFTDFNTAIDILNKAKANVDDASSATDRTDLAPSPFDTDTTVQAALATLNSTTSSQTTTLSGQLSAILGAIQAQQPGSGDSGSSGSGSTIGLLPGFGGSGGRRVNSD